MRRKDSCGEEARKGRQWPWVGRLLLPVAALVATVLLLVPPPALNRLPGCLGRLSLTRTGAFRALAAVLIRVVFLAVHSEKFELTAATGFGLTPPLGGATR